MLDLCLLPTTTPQLKSLRVTGLAFLNGPLPVDSAPAPWGTLSSLTSLEVDILTHVEPAVKQLPNLVELTLSDRALRSGSIALMMSTVPQLQVFRIAAIEGPFADCCTKQELDGLSSMQQLRQADGMRIDSTDLTHPLVMTKCYPSINISVSSADRAGDIGEWAQRGGGKQVTKLLIYGRADFGGSMVKGTVSDWSGLNVLRSLELLQLDLSPGLQQLRGLTQLTHLKMQRCSPDIHSLDQLPTSLCSLSVDNLRFNAALHEQQQQQEEELSSRLVPQLPHLTSLLLSWDSSLESAGRVVTNFISLQQLVLTLMDSSVCSALDPFSQLTSLSSLTIPSFGSGVTEGVSVLAKLPGLQQLEVVGDLMNPLRGLEIAASLGHLTAITLNINPFGGWIPGVFSGGMLQVRGFLA
jgi:hypothetical protein